MLKIGKNFISVVMVVAVAVTAVFGGAMSAAADSIADTAKTELKIGSSYNLALKAPSTPYDYKIVVPVSGSLTISYELYAEVGVFQLFNSDGINVKPTKEAPAVGEGSFRYISIGASGTSLYDTNAYKANWNTVSEKAAGTITYKIDKGIYYLRTARGAVGLSDLKLGVSLRNINDQSVDVNGNIIAPPFIAGATASNVTASLNSGAVSVNWTAVPSARYIVYYVPRNNATGAFGAWSIKTTDTNSYSIASPAQGVTYYITILPYGDTPRVYGGFSAYTLART
ncbi:hypothetical protein FACS1894133_0650 [Clostridia bacterium]|nr:hypothetical protein FACS1894133_0140 [Clostridia bacterium]GHU57553.1 hypothetical protein FACS1894133_0650 [Clostridia bacterium]